MFLNELQGCLENRTANIITHISESEFEKSDRLQLKKEKKRKVEYGATQSTNYPSQVTNVFPVPRSQSAEEFPREWKKIKNNAENIYCHFL